MPLMSKATFRPVAGWASWSLFVGDTALITVGFDRRTTSFSGHPLNSGLDFESNASVVSSHTESGVNLFSAADAAPRSLKSKGTNQHVLAGVFGDQHALEPVGFDLLSHAR